MAVGLLGCHQDLIKYILESFIYNLKMGKFFKNINSLIFQCEKRLGLYSFVLVLRFFGEFCYLYFLLNQMTVSVVVYFFWLFNRNIVKFVFLLKGLTKHRLLKIVLVFELHLIVLLLLYFIDSRRRKTQPTFYTRH